MRGLQLSTSDVSGFLHEAHSDVPPAGLLLLTHGAGGNCSSPLLVAIADTFSNHGMTVLRFDLPFRQRRAAGPPQPARAAEDRAGIAQARTIMRSNGSGPLLMGGHSYGGRQMSMLAAEQPDLSDGLILLSYPLHPPKKPEKLRIEHLANIRTPVLFVHGTKDPFGTVDELTDASGLIPRPTRLVPISGAAHDLAPTKFDVATKTAVAARSLFGLW